MTATLAELRAQPHLSVSQMKIFMQCPRRYALQYVERVTPMFRSASLAFGSAWHATIDEYLLTLAPATPAPVAALKDVFVSELDRELGAEGPPVLFDDDYDDASRLVELGGRMLEAFVASVPVPARVLGIELPFGLELSDAKTGEVLPVPVIGAIDALVSDGAVDVVWELKTAKRRWSDDQVAFDPQPTAYRLAARELGYNAEVALIVTTKTARPEVQLEQAVRGPADEDDLFAIASSVLRAVAAGVDHPSRSWQCRSCPYTAACR